MILLHGWTSLRQTFPIRKSEWVSAFVMLGLALVLLLNDTLFETNPSYHKMAEIAPQHVWQWACFAVAVLRLAVLFVNGAYWRSPHWRAASAFLSCFIWYRIALGIFDNFGIGLVFAIGYFAQDALNFKQAALEAAASEGLRDVERRHKPVG